MPCLKILTNPHKILREKSQNIDKEEMRKEEFHELIENMLQTMKESQGIGLAAPQIGKPIRLIVVAQIREPLVLINPQITKYSWRKEWAEEGCLSIPGAFGLVQRSKIIKVKGLDINGQEIRFKASGLTARVIQHEFDHLEGVLFIDKAKKISNRSLY